MSVYYNSKPLQGTTTTTSPSDLHPHLRPVDDLDEFGPGLGGGDNSPDPSDTSSTSATPPGHASPPAGGGKSFTLTGTFRFTGVDQLGFTGNHDRDYHHDRDPDYDLSAPRGLALMFRGNDAVRLDPDGGGGGGKWAVRRAGAKVRAGDPSAGTALSAETLHGAGASDAEALRAEQRERREKRRLVKLQGAEPR